MSIKFTRPANPFYELPKDLDIYNTTHWVAFIDSKVDPKSIGWPLMDNFSYTLYACLAYILLIVFGPMIFGKLLKEPLNVKPVMVVYNFLVIIVNLVLFVGFVYLVITRRYNFMCNTVDYDDKLSWYLIYGYFLSKGIDFTDTIFMMLRKKFDQASFLHVYHHCSMFLIWYVGARFVGGGSSVTGPMINSFVHTVMYTHYLLTALGFKIPPQWKKRITKMQITQLVFVMVHSLVVAEMGCDFPSPLLYAQAIFLFTLAWLFMRFYQRAYNKNKQLQQQQKQQIKSD